MKKFLLLPMLVLVFILILVFIPMNTYAARAETITASELAELLAGEGITITNMRMSRGRNQQIAKFEGARDIIGFANMDSGLILSTGVANNVFSRRFLSHRYEFHIFAIPDKEYDVVTIEFDAVSDTDWISLQYLFASEEYDQNPIFNDDFYIYVDGVNIALLGNGQPVTINNTRFTSYHYNNYARSQMSFLGYSSLLSCGVNVTPGQKVSFRIEVRDIGDPIFDTAIFLKAKSLSNRPPPPPEEYDDIPEGEVILEINFEKKVSNIRLELPNSNGETFNDLQIGTGATGEVEITGYKTDDIICIDRKSPIYISLEDEITHGTLITIEYTFTFENPNIMPCYKIVVEDFLGENLTYNPKFHPEFNWKWKETSEGERYLEYEFEDGILPEETKEIKLALSGTLVNAGEGNVFDNNAKIAADFGREILEEEAKAQTIIVIPPLGEEIEIMANIAIGIVAYIIILTALTLISTHKVEEECIEYVEII